MSRFSKMAASLLAATSALAAPALAQDELTIGVVVKIGGIPWFNAMEQGIVSRADELGVNAFMVGPTSDDPALQVRAVEDLIARNVDVIGIVPNDAWVLEPVLERAREAGIVVISHEADNLVNRDVNFELVSSTDLGNAHANLFAEATGCEGSYAVFVGGLTVPAHNAWADAAVDHLRELCPNMRQAADRFGVAESVDDSRNTTLDLLRAHDDLAGIIAFGSQGPIGAARAVEERGVAGEVAVVGLFSAGQGQALVHRGSITGGYVWSPIEAGEAFVTLGAMLANGESLTDGAEIDGLGTVSYNDGLLFANMPLELSVDTVDGLAELGL
ncbi:substrate-binding domain-containing protein [Pelagibacterium lentulum]|uniref:Sugar ABC transporter substrate-binding protein n=1 Tax=Pelagibacterium lentulum TaxID=2029865 RepID=A0A916RN40_9HYPH|nr:sugar ABC transporter substrate-binding protein [Pelagibacterium lentulum]